jgi:hypothetical protein
MSQTNATFRSDPGYLGFPGVSSDHAYALGTNASGAHVGYLVNPGVSSDHAYALGTNASGAPDCSTFRSATGYLGLPAPAHAPGPKVSDARAPAVEPTVANDKPDADHKETESRSVRNSYNPNTPDGLKRLLLLLEKCNRTTTAGSSGHVKTIFHWGALSPIAAQVAKDINGEGHRNVAGTGPLFDSAMTEDKVKSVWKTQLAHAQEYLENIKSARINANGCGVAALDARLLSYYQEMMTKKTHVQRQVQVPGSLPICSCVNIEMLVRCCLVMMYLTVVVIDQSGRQRRTQ